VGGAADLSLQSLLRGLLAEPADREHQVPEVGHVMTNAEALARKLLERALRGDDKAQQMVIERVEGKAGRAADPKTGDGDLDRGLEELSLDGLDGLVPR
jgi:hypothetical protein